MILINPKGDKVEFSEKKGKKFIALKAKIKQGWKKATDKVNENSLNNLKQNKPKVDQKPKTKKAKAKPIVKKPKTKKK